MRVVVAVLVGLMASTAMAHGDRSCDGPQANSHFWCHDDGQNSRVKGDPVPDPKHPSPTPSDHENVRGDRN